MGVRIVGNTSLTQIPDERCELLDLFVTTRKIERHLRHIVNATICDPVDLQIVTSKSFLEPLIVVRILVGQIRNTHHHPFDPQLLHELQILIRRLVARLSCQLDPFIRRVESRHASKRVGSTC